MLSAAPAVLVRLKLAGALTPLADAVTRVTVPAMVLAVKASESWPMLLVVPLMAAAAAERAAAPAAGSDEGDVRVGHRVAERIGHGRHQVAKRCRRWRFVAEPDDTTMLAGADGIGQAEAGRRAGAAGEAVTVVAAGHGVGGCRVAGLAIAVGRSHGSQRKPACRCRRRGEEDVDIGHQVAELVRDRHHQRLTKAVLTVAL